MKVDVFYERVEDMSADGRLQLYMEDCGDICVTVIPPFSANRPSVSVQFCTVGSGGGRSPKVMKALRELAIAIEQDNGGIPNFYEKQ